MPFRNIVVLFIIASALTACSAPGNQTAKPSASPSASSASPSATPASTTPSPAASAVVTGKVWTDAELDALQACFRASGVASAKQSADLAQPAIDLIRANRAKGNAAGYQASLNLIAEQQANFDTAFKTNCVKK